MVDSVLASSRGIWSEEDARRRMRLVEDGISFLDPDTDAELGAFGRQALEFLKQTYHVATVVGEVTVFAPEGTTRSE
jgi:hypothetical protein